MFKLIFFILGMNFFGQQINALKCYQGESNMTSDLTATPRGYCPMPAYACAASFDWNRGIINRSCISTNCSADNGKTISLSQICTNSTEFSPQTFCCCYGDGCNGFINHTNTPTTIAQPYVAQICTGVWGNWSEWSECASENSPIFMQIPAINQRFRSRQCLAQPMGCTPNGTIACKGNNWELSPCIGKLPLMPSEIIQQNGTQTNAPVA